MTPLHRSKFKPFKVGEMNVKYKDLFKISIAENCSVFVLKCEVKNYNHEKASHLCSDFKKILIKIIIT